MQIVISVTDLQRKWIENYGFIPDDLNVKMAEVILNGTVLPEHGRLIEEDKLIERLEKLSDDKWNQEVGASKGLDFAIEIVESEPTILEATGEGEQE